MKLTKEEFESLPDWERKMLTRYRFDVHLRRTLKERRKEEYD